MPMNKIKITRFFFGYLIIMFFLNACNTGVVIDKFKKIENGTWRSSDIVRFSVPVEDTLQMYDFYINIRNTNDYAFSNLYVFMKTFYPDGKISADTLEFFLADPQGKWLGSGSGKLIDNRILFSKNIRFPMAGIYSFEFEQAMREEELKGIENFGIRIEKSQKEN